MVNGHRLQSVSKRRAVPLSGREIRLAELQWSAFFRQVGEQNRKWLLPAACERSSRRQRRKNRKRPHWPNWQRKKSDWLPITVRHACLSNHLPTLFLILISFVKCLRTTEPWLAELFDDSLSRSLLAPGIFQRYRVRPLGVHRPRDGNAC